MERNQVVEGVKVSRVHDDLESNLLQEQVRKLKNRVEELKKLT